MGQNGCDITYLPVGDGESLYLATVIDCFSRRPTSQAPRPTPRALPAQHPAGPSHSRTVADMTAATDPINHGRQAA
jgi:hypothetical protein